MTPFVKEKYDILQSIIDRLSKRQKEITLTIKKQKRDIWKKNQMAIEKDSNSAIIRVCQWIKMVLLRVPFEKRYERDKTFVDWLRKYHWYHINRAIYIDVFNEEIPRPIEYFFDGKSYCGCNPIGIYDIIRKFLFPEQQKGGGIFAAQDNIEYDVWYIVFNDLVIDDWKKFKELKKL